MTPPGRRQLVLSGSGSLERRDSGPRDYPCFVNAEVSISPDRVRRRICRATKTLKKGQDVTTAGSGKFSGSSTAPAPAVTGDGCRAEDQGIEGSEVHCVEQPSKERAASSGVLLGLRGCDTTQPPRRPGRTTSSGTTPNPPPTDRLRGIGIRRWRATRIVDRAARARFSRAGFSLVEHPIPPRSLAGLLHKHSREDEYSFVLEGCKGRRTRRRGSLRHKTLRLATQYTDESYVVARSPAEARHKLGCCEATARSSPRPRRDHHLGPPRGRRAHTGRHRAVRRVGAPIRRARRRDDCHPAPHRAARDIHRAAGHQRRARLAGLGRPAPAAELMRAVLHNVLRLNLKKGPSSAEVN